MHFAGGQEIKWALDEDLALGTEGSGRGIAPDLSLAKPDLARGMVAKRLAAWNRCPGKPESRLLF